MPDFLAVMAASSEARARRLNGTAPLLRRRAAEEPPPPRLAPALSGFDLVAEFKRRAPSSGLLSPRGTASSCDAVERARAYERGGAAAVSVLTEPSVFDGSMHDLEMVSRSVTVPVLRKDFLVAPVQVFEARAAGAAGVLLIVRILSESRMREMLDAARECGLFTLLEAFDRDDLERAESAVRNRRPDDVLIGLNARNLATLGVEPERFRHLAGAFPPGFRRVAESSVNTPGDAATVAGLGYSLALVGTALMRASDPAAAVASMIEAGRRAAERRCA